MPAAYWREYRRRRRLAGNPVRRREGYVRNRESERVHKGLGRPRRIRFRTNVPVPVLDRHPLVDQAIGALHRIEQAELFGQFDDVARDLVGEYVLAALEARDPRTAVEAFRSRFQSDRRLFVREAA